mgnify:FL=1
MRPALWKEHKIERFCTTACVVAKILPGNPMFPEIYRAVLACLMALPDGLMDVTVSQRLLAAALQKKREMKNEWIRKPELESKLVHLKTKIYVQCKKTPEEINKLEEVKNDA